MRAKIRRASAGSKIASRKRRAPLPSLAGTTSSASRRSISANDQVRPPSVVANTPPRGPVAVTSMTRESTGLTNTRSISTSSCTEVKIPRRAYSSLRGSGDAPGPAGGAGSACTLAQPAIAAAAQTPVSRSGKCRHFGRGIWSETRIAAADSAGMLRRLRTAGFLHHGAHAQAAAGHFPGALLQLANRRLRSAVGKHL